MPCLNVARQPKLFDLIRFLCLGLMFLAVPAKAGQIDRFFGSYTGSAEVAAADGSVIPRDMSVEIAEEGKGFTVRWVSITYKPDGRTKEKAYEISFVPSDRENVYAAAMGKSVFGHDVQLDPMKGEPYVWGRIVGDTLSVYSLFVDADGSYEMQQFDRTLADDGLMLEFQSIREGEETRAVTTFLKRN